MPTPEEIAALAVGGTTSSSGVVLIVTPEQVNDLAGITVTEAEVARAQFMVSTPSGVELGNAETFALLSLRDQRHLITAVVWQCVYLRQHPEAFTGERAVVSASANGASVTYRDDDGDNDGLSGLAARELAALSWRASPVQVKTLRAYAPVARRGTQPDPWVTLS